MFHIQSKNTVHCFFLVRMIIFNETCIRRPNIFLLLLTLHQIRESANPTGPSRPCLGCVFWFLGESLETVLSMTAPGKRVSAWEVRAADTCITNVVHVHESQEDPASKEEAMGKGNCVRIECARKERLQQHEPAASLEARTTHISGCQIV